MVHTLSLDNYTPTPRKLVLGTNSSYGIESIKIERGAGWDGLNLTATWHIPGREEPLRVALLDGDAMDVPPEVTKEAKDGVLVLAGLAPGVQRASCNVEYLILEQAGVYGGADAEPTPELAAQVLEAALQAKADAEAAAEEAAAAKARAEEAQAASAAAKEAAEAAAADAAKAGPYAEAALAAQRAAEAALDKAITAQQAAENAAAAAAASKSEADTLAAEAARAALAAEESKATANAAANLAGENATAAQQAAENAAAAANYAGQSASDAAASKAAAEIAAQAAQEAQAAAAAARDDAVKAQTAAQTAAKTAQDAQNAAENVRDDAQTAQQGAEAARDAAAKSAEAAAKSEANAKQSADTLAESVENVAANTAAVAELKQQVKNITPDDSTIGDKPWSSKHIIDMLCPPLEESGNPVVCYPVAGYPLGVKAKWEPVQEGSGTPYPAGGGKNLFNPAWMSEKEVSYGVTWTITPDGTVTANGTTDSTAYYNSDYFSLPAGTYTISAMPHFRMTIRNADAGGAIIAAQQTGRPLTFTVENDVQKASLFFAASGTLDNVSAKPQIEKGSTATAYAPYENIRPIKGRDSVTVERCGENLLPFGERIEDIYSQQIMASDALLTLSKACVGQDVTLTFSVETQNIVFNDVVEDEWRKRIGFECNGTLADGTETYSLQCWLDNRDGELSKNGRKTKTVTITMPELAAGDIKFYAQNIKSGSFVAYGFGIYAGTTDPTTYTPYIGQTNTLTLPETVYGGEVDAVTGEGQKVWKSVALDGTENWNTWGVNKNNTNVTGFFTYDINDYSNDGSDIDKILCSTMSNEEKNILGGKNIGVGLAGSGSSKYLIYCITTNTLPDTTDDKKAVASFKTFLANLYAAGTPVQVAYKLATPTPFTATGAQPIPALAGANTILTDADVVEVTGRADPIKRITDLEDAVASQT